MAATKIGHGLAKGLGIKLNYRNELNDEIRRGESVFSSTTADTYVEEEPTSLEWIQGTLPSGQDLLVYTRSLFPFLNWIGSYNLQWLAGDLVAGKHTRLKFVLNICSFHQVLPLEPLSSLKGWRMPFWLIYHHNLGCTHPSWVS